MMFFSIFSKWERFALAALIVIVGVLYVGLWSKNRKISSLSEDLNKSKTALAYIQNSLKQNAIYYDAELKKFQNISPKIVVKHAIVYKRIQDSNTTLEKKVFQYVKEMRNETIFDVNSSTK